MAGATALQTQQRTLLREYAYGDVLLRSVQQQQETCPATVIHSLRLWALKQPYHPLVAERVADGEWCTSSYGTVAYLADAIGEALLTMGLGPGRPLLILSGNTVNHLLMTLGAMTAGIAVAPVSVAHSLRSRDHARLRAIAALVEPGAVYAEDASRYAAALDALGGVPAIIGCGRRPGAARLRPLLATRPGSGIREAFAALSPDSLAKILFESGPEGAPKAVLITHRTLTANQQMMRQAWGSLREERPLVVDGLPWSDGAGGNQGIDMVLANGGTLHIDDGQATDSGYDRTIDNLSDVRPTIFFDVPDAYARLVPALEADAGFADLFFSRLQLAFDAIGALPDELRTRFHEVAIRTTGHAVRVVVPWEAPETGPAASTGTSDHADYRDICASPPSAVVKTQASGPSLTIFRQFAFAFS
ncbi:MAG TPA: AMP-binding protein [Trebonia sp.]|nr:AMP-binding protein [Trebonia sp.]